MHCCTYKSRQKAEISLKTVVKSSFSRMILKCKQFRGNNHDEEYRVMFFQPYAAIYFVKFLLNKRYIGQFTYRVENPVT
jgi:hypothetical protein